MSDDLADKLAAISARERERVMQEKVEERFLNGIAPLLVTPETRSTSDAPPRLADLLDETAHLIVKYARLPVTALAVLVACWIALTYTYLQFRFCGNLGLRSATPRCGKTRLLRLVANLSHGCPSINTTPPPAVLYRRQGKVLILDEVDGLRNADRANFGLVISILNVSFEKGAKIERTERIGGDFKVKEFDVYRPTALAGIESLSDGLADRCFQIQMERTADRMPRFSVRVLEDLFVQLRSGFQTWADQHGPAIETAYEGLPDAVEVLKEYDDRFQDIADPLMVLAALADEERPEGPTVMPRLLKGLAAAAGRRDVSNRERELLAFLAVVDPIMKGENEIFIGSQALLDSCKECEDLSYIETTKALAGFLRHFDLKPGFNTEKTLRGYTIKRAWWTAWRHRYGTRSEEPL